jgi:uncharacterized protein (TIGR04552 family)
MTVDLDNGGADAPQTFQPGTKSEAELSAHALADLMGIQTILRGTSIVDQSRVWFEKRKDVVPVLSLCGSLDLQRIQEIYHEAIDYLLEVHGYDLPAVISDSTDIHDVFLLASDTTQPLQISACMVLKVMHVLHLLNGRELLFNIKISEAELLDRLSVKVFRVIDRMRASGIQVREFSSGKKTRVSILTKLLARKLTQTTEIFDKRRFRLILENRNDLVNAVRYLSRELFPYNCIVPGQSENGILAANDLAQAFHVDESVILRHWRDDGSKDNDVLCPNPSHYNEFSGSTYSCVSLVAEIPLRIDDLSPEQVPAIVFAETEIQLIDAATDLVNSTGENAHTRYKSRQRSRARERLYTAPPVSQQFDLTMLDNGKVS